MPRFADGISDASFSMRRARYGRMDASMVSRTKALEEESRRLKRIYADLSMRDTICRRTLLGKSYGPPRYCKDFCV